jgi:predicted  nucleic acid-binding Zn-ribbon protein
MSEIFDNYVKIAEEMGLVEPEKPKESAKLRKFKKEVYPRAGSDTIDVIENLYDVKPNSPVEYKRNIFEAAHKEPVIIAPAYDRLNALFENDNERADIIHNIVSKPVNGNITHHRYAANQLMMELIRVANDMDNKNHDEIRTLADDCIDKIAFEFSDITDWLKERAGDAADVFKGSTTAGLFGGILGGVLGAIAGGQAFAGARLGFMLGDVAGGLISSITKTIPQVRSISVNSKDLISQIDDVKSKLPQGSELDFLNNFQQELNKLSDLSNNYNDIVSNVNNSTSNTDKVSANKITTDLKKQITTVYQYMNSFNSKVKLKIYEPFINHSKALTPLYNLIDDDIEDVQKSIKSLQFAMAQFNDQISEISAHINNISETQKPEENQDTEEELFGKTEEKGKPTGNNLLEKELGNNLSDKEVEYLKSLFE